VHAVDSTLDDVRDAFSTRRGRAGRRVAVAVMAVLVTLGAAGAFGVRTGVARTRGADGYTLRVSTFELVLYVAMGDLVQQGVTQQDYSVTGAVLAVGTFISFFSRRG
jgi:hypothetical protein